MSIFLKPVNARHFRSSHPIPPVPIIRTLAFSANCLLLIFKIIHYPQKLIINNKIPTNNEKQITTYYVRDLFVNNHKNKMAV